MKEINKLLAIFYITILGIAWMVFGFIYSIQTNQTNNAEYFAMGIIVFVLIDSALVFYVANKYVIKPMFGGQQNEEEVGR